MKNNKKIQFLLLFFTMLIGFVFATTVNADVTKDGDVYHITTGQDLDMLLGLGNNSGYWNGTDNKTPTSIKISVDNDITLVKQQHEINSVFKDTIDIDFNDHMYYVTDQDNSSFTMDGSTRVDVFVRNLKSSASNVANTTGTLAEVPDPTDATNTVAGYLLSANSLFTGAGSQSTANGTVTYDNVLINYPNIHDGKSQMLTTGYVPIKFTGTNLLALGGQSGANFCRTTDLTVVDGDTTMTWGPGLGGNSTAMFNMRDGVGYPTSSVNFTVGSGATLTINNHVNANTIVSGNNAGKIVNITNNGILTATIDGYATDSSSTFQAATSSFVSGGTGLTNTNITFGPNAVTTITSNTGLIQMDKVAILNIKAQSNSQTTLTSKNIRSAATARVFNGTATSGSSLTLDSVDSFSMRSVATAPLQQDNMRIVIANTPLTILGYAANNDTVTARYVAEIGSINGAWDGNGTPGDQMSPPLATNNSETKLKPAFGIRFEPGVLANSFTVNPSVWNYALSNPIFPADNTPVWLSRNGSGDNTQTFDIYDSRSQTASFRLQALVTGTGSRQYGFKKNGTSEVLSLNDQAQTILNASDFTAGTIGDAATAGHWTYTTDADHGLLVQAARSEKIGTYTGSVTYSLVDGLE